MIINWGISMNSYNKLPKVTKTIIWIARIWSALILAFVLFFLLAYIFGNDESGEGFRSVSEIVQFICFPVSTVVGLSIALKFEGLGGFITVIGMIILFILRPDLIFNPLAIMIIPGLLFITYWYLSRNKSYQTET